MAGIEMPGSSEHTRGPITMFFCGDLMTGRGIDQILPHPSDPVLYEPFMKSALGYVELAKKATGETPRPVDYGYIWGDALDELRRIQIRPESALKIDEFVKTLIFLFSVISESADVKIECRQMKI
jgi:poly-gamma-glutamate capsule biosynthesis protein CapA/YwtB (metallophosphatase superfamily)